MSPLHGASTLAHCCCCRCRCRCRPSATDSSVSPSRIASHRISLQATLQLCTLHSALARTSSSYLSPALHAEPVYVGTKASRLSLLLPPLAERRPRLLTRATSYPSEHRGDQGAALTIINLLVRRAPPTSTYVGYYSVVCTCICPSAAPRGSMSPWMQGPVIIIIIIIIIMCIIASREHNIQILPLPSRF
jgi:hypothetical protein